MFTALLEEHYTTYSTLMYENKAQNLSNINITRGTKYNPTYRRWLWYVTFVLR